MAKASFLFVWNRYLKFSAHSFRGASTSKPLGAGVSLKDILETANWASAKTFYKFYFEDVVHVENTTLLIRFEFLIVYTRRYISLS
jgi:hypothetical protein